jgi:imidazoleglycerol-phosphate dehydratase
MLKDEFIFPFVSLSPFPLLPCTENQPVAWNNRNISPIEPAMQTSDRQILSSLNTEPISPARTASIRRTTSETDVQVTLNLDGVGKCIAATGVPFLDHMLHQIASHALIDLQVKATGDIEIDDHHTNEDVGITVGQALSQALSDRKGIVRFGNFLAPLDEALIQVALDFSGRPHLSYGLQIPTQRVGTYDTQLVREFFVALVNHSQMTLHIRQLDGVNSHHIIEATFKAFARSLRMAVEIDPRRAGAIPSSKGVL